MPNITTGCERTNDALENDLPTTTKGDIPVDKTHWVAVAKDADIIAEAEDYRSEENPPKIATVGSETVSSQGEVGKANSEEEISGKEVENGIGSAMDIAWLNREQGVSGEIVTQEGDLPDGVLLATVLPEVRSLHFGKEGMGKGVQESSGDEGTRKKVGVEKVKYEKEVTKNTKDGADNGGEREMKAGDLLEESSRSRGRIEGKFKADTEASLEVRESVSNSDLSKENSVEGIPSDSAPVFLKMAAIHHQESPTEIEENCFDDGHSKEGSAGEYLVPGSSFDMEPLKEDFADRSGSGVDLSEEIGCKEECRNRAQEEGFPEEQEATQCAKGMMLDVWGYCRFVHFSAGVSPTFTNQFVFLLLGGSIITRSEIGIGGLPSEVIRWHTDTKADLIFVTSITSSACVKLSSFEYSSSNIILVIPFYNKLASS